MIARLALGHDTKWVILSVLKNLLLHEVAAGWFCTIFYTIPAPMLVVTLVQIPPEVITCSGTTSAHFISTVGIPVLIRQ